MKTALHSFLLLLGRKSRSLYCFLIAFLLLTSTVLAQAPANDNCATAVTLTPGGPGAGCAGSTAGTLANATNSGVPYAPCSGNSDDDVWYKFTTTSTDHTITLSNLGTNITGTGGGARI